MEVTGRLKLINKTQTFGSGFNKRDVVVTTEEQYPQHILIEFVQDKCAILDGYKVGDGVKIGVNLRGREWINPQGESKYFNSIQGWKISKIEGASGDTPVFDAQPMDDEEEDDLPF